MNQEPDWKAMYESQCAGAMSREQELQRVRKELAGFQRARGVVLQGGDQPTYDVIACELASKLGREECPVGLDELVGICEALELHWNVGRMRNEYRASVTRPSPIRPHPTITDGSTPHWALCRAILTWVETNGID